MKNLITIVLMCHNRPEFAVSTIKSILSQSEKNFRFVVSDNSSNTEMQEIMKVSFPSVEYKSWFPGVPIVEHVKKVVALVDTQYFVMFHDDDLMEPDYLKKVLEEFRKMPSAAAVSVNGWLINEKDEKIKDQVSFNPKDKSEDQKITVISEEKHMLNHYLADDFGGVPAFSPYAYDTELIKGLYPDYVSPARNYCDTTFLMDVVCRGPIVWIHEPLVRIRIHGSTLSKNSGVCDYKGFYSLIKKNFGRSVKYKFIEEYRFVQLFFALRKRNRLPYPALKYFVFAFVKLVVLSHSFRKRVVKKIFA